MPLDHPHDPEPLLPGIKLMPRMTFPALGSPTHACEKREELLITESV